MASQEESFEPLYSKQRTMTLQKRLEATESQLDDLRQRFPGYRSYDVGAAFGFAPGDAVPPWYQEMQRLSRARGQIAAELSKRGKLRASGDSSDRQEQVADRKSIASSKRANILASSKKADADVAKRRTLAKTNRRMLVSELCELLGREAVPLPSKWQDAGFRSWSQAYKDANYRSRIDVLISKDRRSV